MTNVISVANPCTFNASATGAAVGYAGNVEPGNNQWNVLASGGSTTSLAPPYAGGGNAVNKGQALPTTSGASVTANGFTLTYTGSTMTDSGGGTIGVYQFAVDSTIAAAGGYTLQINQSTGAPLYWPFNVISGETVITAGVATTIPIGYQPNLSANPGTGYEVGNAGWNGNAGHDGSQDAFPSVTWVIDDNQYYCIDDSTHTAPSGTQDGNHWTVTQPDSTHIRVTPPVTLADYDPNSTGATDYCVYYQQSNGTYNYAVFDVVPAATPQPGFTLAPSPYSLSVAQGGTGTDTITVTSSNGFNAAVTFAASGLPTGVSVAFLPTSVTPAANGAASTTATFTVASSTITGNYAVTITGTSGTTTATQTVNLTVTAATAPAAPVVVPTFASVTATSVTLNNVPALSAGQAVNGLPASLVVSGAGVSAVNGTYTLAAGTDSNSNRYYTSADSVYLYYYVGPGYWVFGTTLDSTNSSTFYYLYANSGYSATSVAPGPYSAAGGLGNAPYPTASNSSGNAATSLSIQRALDSGFATGLTTFANVTPSTNYTDNTVTAATTYYYRYVDVNAAGASPGPVGSVTTPAAPPATPTLSAYGQISMGQSQIRLYGL